MVELHAGRGQRVIKDAASLLSISSDWDELVSDSSASVFQTFGWQSSWWKHFASNGRNNLLVIVFSEEEKVIGIAPFFIQVRMALGSVVYRQLKLLGSGLKSEKSRILSMETEGPGDYLDVIARNGYEDTAGGMVADFLSSNRHHWDEIELQNVPETGVLIKHVLPRLRDSHFAIKSTVSDVCPRVVLHGSWEDTLTSMSTRARRSFRRAQRSYLENNEFTVEETGTFGTLDEALDELTRLHQKHWNSAGYPGLFSDSRFNLLYRELAKVLYHKGQLWLTVLRHGQKAIAARLCFVYKDRVYDYLSGVDLSAGNDERTGYSGAGTALLASTMKRAGDSGYRFFDLLRGDEGYKSDLTPHAGFNYRIVIVQRESLGFIRSYAFRLMAGWFGLRARIICELTILKIITEEKGILAAGRMYPAHLKNRLKKKQSIRDPRNAGIGGWHESATPMKDEKYL